MTGFQTKVAESFDLMYFNGLSLCLDATFSASLRPTETKCVFKVLANLPSSVNSLLFTFRLGIYLHAESLSNTLLMIFQILCGLVWSLQPSHGGNPELLSVLN